MAKVTYKFNLTIEVDAANIDKKYPNYRFNFADIDEFVESLIANMTNSSFVEEYLDTYERYGFKINIKEKK